MNFSQTKNIVELFAIYKQFNHLSQYYPDFEDWYYNKAIPNILTGDGTALVMRDKFDDIIGTALFNTRKLQMVRIMPEYQKKGYCLSLLDESLKLMGQDKPFVTVSEELFHHYSRIFINRYDFSLQKVENGMYRKGVLEYLFNDKPNLKEKTMY